MARKKRVVVKQQQQRVKASLVETNALIIRTEQVVAESNMSAQEVNASKYTRRGTVAIGENQYYFSANRFGIPVVFGATDINASLELAKALDNKLKEAGKDQSFFKEDIEAAYNKANVYADEISDGILIIKEGNKYFGYMPGKAGCRAVCYRTGGKHYSCAVSSLIKYLDRPGKQSFRQMASQGKDIANMIEKFNFIIGILDKRTSPDHNPDDRPRRGRRNNSQGQPEQQTNNNERGDKPKRGRRNKPEDKPQQQKIDTNNDEQVAALVNKVLEVCVKDESLDNLLIQLTGNNAVSWIDEINEFAPSVDEIAESFRDDVVVLLNDERYQILASAVI